jgi:hypothetical protein
LLTGRSDARILNEPCEVHFAGFRTDTYRLQQAGWQLSMEQDIARMSIRLAMRFEPARLYMVSNAVEHFYLQHGCVRPVFHVQHCASNITVQLMESSFDFEPIDATPAYVTTERKSIEDFGIFAPLQTRTEEILVEPQSVAECLELIKKLQAPDLAAIRKRNEQRRRDQGSRDYGNTGPLTQLHAQIVTLAA